MVAPCCGYVPSFPPLAPPHALVHDFTHFSFPHTGLGVLGAFGGPPFALLVTGSHLFSPLLWGFTVCLVVNALANPGFHLVQTIGLSRADYQAYACGGQFFLMTIDSWTASVLPSWGIAYHAHFFPLP